jgi:hypothetical protein
MSLRGLVCASPAPDLAVEHTPRLPFPTVRPCRVVLSLAGDTERQDRWSSPPGVGAVAMAEAFPAESRSADWVAQPALLGQTPRIVLLTSARKRTIKRALV